MSIKKMSRKGIKKKKTTVAMGLWDIIDVINDSCPREFIKEALLWEEKYKKQSSCLVCIKKKFL